MENKEQFDPKLSSGFDQNLLVLDNLVGRSIKEHHMDNQPVIIITGASSGIGAETARVFGGAGYRVVLAARRAERLESLSAEIISGGGDALPIKCDVVEQSDIEGLVAQVMERYQQVDILLNNAGIGRLDWLEKLHPQEDISAQVAVNLLGTIQVTRAVLPHMIARRSGHIINMSSLGGLLATPTYSVYAATKFGVRGFTDALRREVSVWDINVSAIYPGGVVTEFTDQAGIVRKTGVTTPRYLKLSAEDVATAVLKLARKPKRMLVMPRSMYLVIWLNAFAPGFVDWLIEHQFTRPERGL